MTGERTVAVWTNVNSVREAIVSLHVGRVKADGTIADTVARRRQIIASARPRAARPRANDERSIVCASSSEFVIVRTLGDSGHPSGVIIELDVGRRMNARFGNLELRRGVSVNGCNASATLLEGRRHNEAGEECEREQKAGKMHDKPVMWIVGCGGR